MTDSSSWIPAEHDSGVIPCIHCKESLDAESLEPLDAIRCPLCGGQQVVPAKLGKYVLDRFLGEGAMGRVYQAEDRDLKRQVAIKILREDLGSTPQMWSLLESEARAAGSISHHNVVQIFSFSKIKGRPYIVMELVEDGSLQDYLNDVGPLDTDKALKVAIDVMKGLKAANAIELIHGDIKPANIILTEEGDAKVADFGLARFNQDPTVVERWGTPYYIAPEKSRQIQEDFRSDMYSLGATLFHVVSGHPPFKGTDAEEVIHNALRKSTPHLHMRYPDCSRDFSEIVFRMMQRDPDDRFWSYDKAITCCERLQQGNFKRGDTNRRAGDSMVKKLKRSVNSIVRKRT